MSTKNQLLTISALLVLIVISLVGLNKNKLTSNSKAYEKPLDLPSEENVKIVTEQLESESMASPDGTRVLRINREVKNGSIKNTISVSDKNYLQIYSSTMDIDLDNILSIPYNTWSPDNKYFFLNEYASQNHEYYVILSSGENLLENSNSLDIQNLFLEKVPGFVITDVTGWAGPTLIIVNTKQLDGGSQVSFWFDVASRSFIKLGTFFR